MRTKFTLFLVFLNVALFYTIFYLRTESNRVVADINLILGPEAANLKALSIESAEGATISLNESEGQWVISRPLVWNANAFAVRAILNELNSLRAETTFPVSDLAASGQTLADYGLEKPRIRLVLTPDSGSPITLQIGNATQGGNRLYLLSSDGQRIHVVNQSLAEGLSVGLSELRAEVLFDIPVFEAQALTVETTPGQRTLLRRDGSRWNIETLQALANRVDTELTLGHLTGLKISTFLDSKLAASLSSAFASPELRVTLEGNARRQTLLLGAPAPADATPSAGHTNYYAQMEGDARRQGTVFTVSFPDDLRDTLKRAQRDLREKRLLDIDMARVSTLTLQNAEGEVSLQRLDAQGSGGRPAWQIVTRREDQSLASEPADTDVVERLLGDLARLSAEEFTNDAPSQAERENYGFVRPARRLTFGLRAEGATAAPAPVVLLIATGADQRTYAGLANREPVFRVSSEVLTQIPVRALAYREHTLRELPAGARITRLRLEDLAAGKSVIDVALGDTPPPEKVAALLTHLRHLRAAELLGDFTANGPLLDGTERAWAHRVDVDITPAGGNPAEATTQSLFLAPRTGGITWVAGCPSPSFNFVLEPDLVEALFALTFGDRDPGAPKDPPPAG